MVAAVKTLSQSENKHLVVDSRFARLPRFGWIVLLIGGAAFLGWNVAQERWLLLVAVAAVPLVLLWPVPLAFGAYAFLVPFDSVALIGPEKYGVSLTFLVGVLAGAVLLITGYLRQSLERPTMPALWWFLFVAWGGLCSLWAIDQNRALVFLPTALGLLFLYLVAASVRITREEFSWVVLATILGGCAAAAYSCSQYYSGVFYHAALAGRSSLIIGEKETDPNVFAAALFLPLSLVVWRFLESRGWYRILYLAMGGLTALAVVLTMSRGALLGLAVMVFIYFRRLGLDRRVLIPVSIVLLTLIALPHSFLARLQSTVATGGEGRLYVWEVGFAALKHYGLFGAGLQNFGEAYTKYAGEGSRVFHYGSFDAHNIYLEVAVEQGIVGLGLMGMALFSAMRAGRVQSRLNQWVVNSTVPYEAAAWAMLTSSFFVGMLWRKAFWLVWIMYALVVTLAKDKTGHFATDAPTAVTEIRPATLSWNR
jgi:putative inorganic carbon (hco3(-)) transporter